MNLMLIEPLEPQKAKQLIRSILSQGGVNFSPHAEKEMLADRLMEADILCVLRGGLVEPAEFELGSWRYRVRTNKIFVVVAFRSESEIRIVTAWRIKRR